MSDDLGIDIVLRANSTKFLADAQKAIDRARAIVEGRPLSLFGGADDEARESKRAMAVARAVNTATEVELKRGLKEQDRLLASNRAMQLSADGDHKKALMRNNREFTDAYIRESQRRQDVERRAMATLRFREIAEAGRAEAEQRRVAGVRSAAMIEYNRRQAAQAHVREALSGGVFRPDPTPYYQQMASRNKAGKSGGRVLQAVYQGQQAIEDFSFAGFRGAGNNIAYLAASLGGPAGLVALAGLAGVSLLTMAQNQGKAASAASEHTVELEREREAIRSVTDASREASIEFSKSRVSAGRRAGEVNEFPAVRLDRQERQAALALALRNPDERRDIHDRIRKSLSSPRTAAEMQRFAELTQVGASLPEDVIEDRQRAKAARDAEERARIFRAAIPEKGPGFFGRLGEQMGFRGDPLSASRREAAEKQAQAGFWRSKMFSREEKDNLRSAIEERDGGSFRGSVTTEYLKQLDEDAKGQRDASNKVAGKIQGLVVRGLKSKPVSEIAAEAVSDSSVFNRLSGILPDLSRHSSLVERKRRGVDLSDYSQEKSGGAEARINRIHNERIHLLQEEMDKGVEIARSAEQLDMMEQSIKGRVDDLLKSRDEELAKAQSLKNFASDVTQASRELLSLEKQKSNEYEQQVRAKQELIQRTDEEKVKSRQSFVSSGFGLLRDKGRQFMEQAGAPEWMIQRREMGLYNMQAGLLSRNAATAGKTGNFEEQIDSLKELQRLQLEVVGKTGSPWMANASFSAAIQTQQQIEAAYEAQKASANQAIGQLGALQVQANITADSVKRIADYKFDFGIDGEIAKLIGFRDILAATRAALGADAHLTEVPAIPAGVPGAAPGMRGGGLMPGYGGGDRRQIVVEDGEYVVRKEAVKAHGVETLNRLNNRFASGGLVAARELRGQPGWRRPGERGDWSNEYGLVNPFLERRPADANLADMWNNASVRDMLISSGWIATPAMIGAITGNSYRPGHDAVTNPLPGTRSAYAGGSSLANGAASPGHDSRSMAEVRASARRSAIAQGVKFPEQARYYRNGKLMNPHDFAMGSESTLNRSGRSLRSEIEAQQAQRSVASVREAEGRRKSAEAAQVAQNRRHNIGPSPLVAGDRMARARTAGDAREADATGAANRARTELADLQFGREHGGNALAARQKQRFNDLLFNIGQPQSQLGAAAGPATHSASGDPLVQMGAMGSTRSSVSTLSGLGQYASYTRGAGNAAGAATRGVSQLQTALAGRRAEYAAEMANRRAMHASQMADRRKSGVAGRGGSLSRYLASRNSGGWRGWGGGFGGGGGGVPMAGGLPGFGSSGFSGPGTRTFGLWDGLQRFARGGLVAGRDYEGLGAYDIGGGVTREGGGGFDYLGGGYRIGGPGMEDPWEKQRRSVLSGRWSGGMDAGAMGRGEYGYFSDGSRKSRFSGGFSTILKDGAGMDFGGGRSGDYGYFSDGSARSRFSGGFAAGGLVGAYSQQQAQAMAAMMRNSGSAGRSASGATSTTNNSSMHFGNFNVNVKNAGDLADLMSQQKRIEHAARLRRG